MQPLLGVFGGSGFYKMQGELERVDLQTPYGTPSSQVETALVGGKSVAFIPRHGSGHLIPPHKINFRANVYAMREVGVKQIVAPFACGSLQPGVKPGDFVVVDQFVDRTSGRADTFFNGPEVVHINGAEPYCPRLRRACAAAAKKAGVKVHERGTAVVIQGPRFSTRAESRWFSQQGWNVITMTQYPEVVLARELGLCYAGVGLVTDYDVGLEGSAEVPPVTARDVVRVFKENNAKLAGFLQKLVQEPALEKIECNCANAVQEGKIN